MATGCGWKSTSTFLLDRAGGRKQSLNVALLAGQCNSVPRPTVPRRNASAIVVRGTAAQIARAGLVIKEQDR